MNELGAVCLSRGDDDLKDRIYERLMEPGRFETDARTGCYIFCGAWYSVSGVGRMRVGEKVYNISRVAAWVYHGIPLWSNDVAYHRCHSPACFAPDHIGCVPNRRIAQALSKVWGLGQGRALRHRAFTAGERRQMLSLAHTGMGADELAIHFGATEMQVLGFFDALTKERQ